MARINPRLGPDFRPGYRPDRLKGDQPIRFTDEGHFVLLSEHQPDGYLEDDPLRAARGIIHGFGRAVAMWAFIIAVIALLVWGI